MSAVGVVRIHKSVFYEMRALTEEGESEDEMISNIDRIRHTLRLRIQEGKASFLPRSTSQVSKGAGRTLRLEATVTLLEGSAECQALCIDDRFINSHSTFVGPDQQSKPIMCVLDTLNHLVALERMTMEQFY